MNDTPTPREACRYCGKPRANAQDCDEIPEGEGEHLCWQILQGCDQDAEEAINLRDAKIAELERELEQERQDRKQALEILWRCGLHPGYYDTLEKAATGAWEQVQDLRRDNIDPPAHVIGSAMRKMGVHGFMEEGETATLKLEEYADPNNLEGPGPSEDERRENARAIQALSVPERIALMFGKTETKDD